MFAFCWLQCAAHFRLSLLMESVCTTPDTVCQITDVLIRVCLLQLALICANVTPPPQPSLETTVTIPVEDN